MKATLTFHVVQEEGSEAIEGWGISDGWVVEGNERDNSLTNIHPPWRQGMRHLVVAINEGRKLHMALRQF